MKSSLIAVCICCISLASVTTMSATIELPASGQIDCYDATGASVACSGTGQDADLLAGIRWPDPRLTDNGDGTVTDNLTGLMWLTNASCLNTQYTESDGGFNDGYFYWTTALAFVIGINDGTYQNCQAGYADWRLPNINELKSLFDYSQTSEPLPASHPFTNLKSSYWSSTTHSTNRANAFAVSMNDGHIFPGTKSGGSLMAAVPVRDSSVQGIVSLPQTGQATCYDAAGTVIACANTGQDAELAAGVVWPNPRFTDNGDGTVTDELTGLIWFGDVTGCMGGAQNWASALATISDLNLNPTNYHGVSCDYTGTHGDWRLPNIRELESLAHFDFAEEGAYGSSADWLDALGVGFDAVASLHWSSTSDVGSTGDAFTQTFAALGGTNAYDKDGGTSNYYVWPVRGSVYGDPDITVSPVTVDFGSVTIGDSGTQEITVTNDGTYYLEVDATAALTAPFSITNDGCADQVLAPAETCTITVSYNPTADSVDSKTATVASDDPDEATVAVSLSGTGSANPNNPPTAFELIYPEQGTTGLGTTVTMIWKAATDPDGGTLNYDITYCEDETFATCTALENVAAVRGESRWMKFAQDWAKALITGPLSLMGCGGSTAATSSSATPTLNADELSYTATDLNPATTYHWKVTTNDADGGATESEARSFTTQ